MKEMALFTWFSCGQKIEATFVVHIFFPVGILVQVSKNNKY